MFYVSKAQYQQLARNTKDGVYPPPYAAWVVPYGQGRDFNQYLLCFSDQYPGKVLNRNEEFDDEGNEHVFLQWVPYKVFRFKFLHDLTLAYVYWRDCRQFNN